MILAVVLVSGGPQLRRRRQKAYSSAFLLWSLLLPWRLPRIARGTPARVNLEKKKKRRLPEFPRPCHCLSPAALDRVGNSPVTATRNSDGKTV